MKKCMSLLCVLLCFCLAASGCQEAPEVPVSTPTASTSTTTTEPVTTPTTTVPDTFDPAEYPLKLRTLEEVEGEPFNMDDNSLQIDEQEYLVVLEGGKLTRHNLTSTDPAMVKLADCEPLATDVAHAWVSGKFAFYQTADNAFFVVNLLNSTYRYPITLPGELTDEGEGFGHGFEIWDFHGPYIAGQCCFDVERQVTPVFLYHLGTGEITWLPERPEVRGGGMLDGKLYYTRNDGIQWEIVAYDIASQTEEHIHEPIPSNETVLCNMKFTGRDILLFISAPLNGPAVHERYREYNWDGTWTVLEDRPHKKYDPQWYLPEDEDVRYYVLAGYLYKLPEFIFE